MMCLAKKKIKKIHCSGGNHGLSGLFRAVSAVEPSLFRPPPPPPVPNKPSCFCGHQAKCTRCLLPQPVQPARRTSRLDGQFLLSCSKTEVEDACCPLLQSFHPLIWHHSIFLTNIVLISDHIGKRKKNPTNSERSLSPFRKENIKPQKKD